MANYERALEPISQEETLAYYIRKGWKIIDRENKLIFVQASQNGIIRLIDENGYMRHLSAINSRWEEPKIKGFVENNVKIEMGRARR